MQGGAGARTREVGKGSKFPVKSPCPAHCRTRKGGGVFIGVWKVFGFCTPSLVFRTVDWSIALGGKAKHSKQVIHWSAWCHVDETTLHYYARIIYVCNELQYSCTTNLNSALLFLASSYVLLWRGRGIGRGGGGLSLLCQKLRILLEKAAKYLS